jgi:hypothetical protein
LDLLQSQSPPAIAYLAHHPQYGVVRQPGKITNHLSEQLGALANHELQVGGDLTCQREKYVPVEAQFIGQTSNLGFGRDFPPAFDLTQIRGLDLDALGYLAQRECLVLSLQGLTACPEVTT